MIRRLLRADDGGTALELCMFVPVWTVILTLIVQLTLVWWAEAVLDHAATRGARAAIVQIPRSTPLEPRNHLTTFGFSTKRDAIRDAMTGVLRLVAADAADAAERLDIELQGGSAGAFDATALVTLEADFRMPLNVPVANRFLGSPDPLGGFSRPLEARALMRNEGLARFPEG